MINWRERLHASGVHLGISLAIAALAAYLVFRIWYPYPYREVSGGRELFVLLVVVDVILGPLITLAVFNRAKPWTELRRDLAVVGLLQLSALGYGMWTVAAARPVHLVFEVDRFRAVHAIEVPENELDRASPEVKAMPWLGPTLLAVRPFRSSDESMKATMAALEGLHLGLRPELWQPYDAARATALQAARPVGELKSRFPREAAEIDRLVSASGRPADGLKYLPFVSRTSFWTAFVDATTADVVAFMPLDPF
jgi:hypothetical protein